MPIVDKHVRIAEHVTSSAFEVGLTSDNWIVYYDPTPAPNTVVAQVSWDLESRTATIRFSRKGLRRVPRSRNEALAHELIHITDAPLEEELSKIDMTDTQRQRINALLEARCNMLEGVVAKALPPWPEEN